MPPILLISPDFGFLPRDQRRCIPQYQDFGEFHVELVK